MAIKWHMPIEAEDGTPLKLSQHGQAVDDNTNPDSDGWYWVMRADENETPHNTYAFDPRAYLIHHIFGRIRNSVVKP